MMWYDMIISSSFKSGLPSVHAMFIVTKIIAFGYRLQLATVTL